MAVVSVKLKGQRTFEVDDKPTIKGKRTYLVKCDDKNDDADVATEGVAVVVGSAYSSKYPGVLARGVSAEEGERTADGGIYYLITVDYSSQSDNQKGGEPGADDPDPTQRPGILRLSYDSSEETVHQAKAEPTAETGTGAALDIGQSWVWGKSLCSSAGIPFKDGLKESFADAVYSYEKNVGTLDWVGLSDLLDTYINTVNIADFTVTYRGATKRFKKGTVLLTSPTSEPGFENGILFEKVTFQLKVRKDGWNRKVLDQGTRAFTPASKTPVKSPIAPPIPDERGDPVTEPALLDGKGHRLTQDGVSVFLVFRTKDEQDFSKLPF
jgi:hypothetical protein